MFDYKYKPLLLSTLYKSPMHPISPTQRSHILSLLDAGQSTHQIAKSTGLNHSTISRLRSKHRSSLSKSTGGRPSKLTSTNI